MLTEDRIALLRGTLVLIAEGRGPAPEMAREALARDDRNEPPPVEPGRCECGRPLGHD